MAEALAVIEKFADPTPALASEKYGNVYRYEVSDVVGGNYDDNQKVYRMGDFADDVMRTWDRNSELHLLTTVDGQSFMQAFEMAQDMFPHGRL